MLRVACHSRREAFFALAAVEEVPTLLKAALELSGDSSPRLRVGLGIFKL